MRLDVNGFLEIRLDVVADDASSTDLFANKEPESNLNAD